MKKSLVFLSMFALSIANANQTDLQKTKEIREYMDLQTHLTMHLTYGFFGQGMQWIKKGKTPKLGHRHTFKNVIYADFHKNNSGARIIINGAMAAEVAFTKKQARRKILKQIKYVDDFAAKNSKYFIVAKTPEEVRHAIHNTKKTVILHSIEGMRKILNGPEDAKFWASKGVAFVTLIHLLDDEFGGSAITPDKITWLINLRGTFRKLFGKKKKRKNRGLTQKGKEAIKWLADAGIMIDLTHMAPEAKDDALEIMEKHQIPPLLTHSMMRSIHNHDRALTQKQLLKVYKLGGLFSLPISGLALKEYKPTDAIKADLAKQKLCKGSMDSYRYSFGKVDGFLQKHSQELLGLPYDELSEVQKVELSIGWSSDFNGWSNHSRPRFGRKGCYKVPKGKTLPEIETKGLAHPGLLPQMWASLEKEGMNTDPLKRSSEKFLKLWELFLKKAK